MKKQDKKTLMYWGILIGAVSVFLCIRWFDWRLLVVIFLALFGNNLSQQK